MIVLEASGRMICRVYDYQWTAVYTRTIHVMDDSMTVWRSVSDADLTRYEY